MINKNISKKDLYGAYKLFFNTLSSEPRLKIINLLRKKKMNVSEIQEALGYEQSVISHNLKRLRICGFVSSNVKKKYRYYNLNKKTISPILALIDKHMEKNCLMIIKGGKI